MANLRLKRLKIEKYRGVAPNTELFFNDGMNVLLGRNGTGKTTLLQLIAIIARSAFGALVGEHFSIEYDVDFGIGTLRVALANRPIESGQRTLLRDWRRAEGPRSEWSFGVDLLFDDGSLSSIISATPAGVSTWLKRKPGQEPFPVRDPLRDASPVEQAIDVINDSFTEDNLDNQKEIANVQIVLNFAASVLEHQHRLRQHGGRFDEGLGTFGAIVGGPGYLSVEDAEPATLYCDADPIDIMSFFTPEAVEVAATRHVDTTKLGDITLPDKELPFFRRALDLIGCIEGTMILKLEKEIPLEDGGSATYSSFEFLLTMDDGTVLRHDFLSYGQKRLLSFLYYVAANLDIIIADELVNGLHHEWIEACFEQIKDRQCFLTSQNPLLLDYLSFESAEEVQRAFILCDRVKEGKRAQMLWRNIEHEAAAGFFRAYRAGVQHVSEILRTKGLW